MSKKRSQKKKRKNLNLENKMEGPEKIGENTQEKLANLIKERDKKIAEIDGQLNKPQESAPTTQSTQPEPVISNTVEVEEDTIEPENVMEEVEISDDVNTALMSVFKEVIRSPHAVPGKVIPFAQVLLRKRIMDLKSIDPKVIGNTINRFGNIWDAFGLSEADDMLFLNDAINGEIRVLNDVQREIEVNEKALHVLSDKNTNVSVDRKKFGAGLL